MSYLVSEARRLNLLDAVNAYSDCITYRGFIISYDPPPIPVRTMDYHFVHEQYDGAEDSHDHRCGGAASLGAAMAGIDEMLEELGPY